jgi:hypothetical protein
MEHGDSMLCCHWQQGRTELRWNGLEGLGIMTGYTYILYLHRALHMNTKLLNLPFTYSVNLSHCFHWMLRFLT